MSNHDDNIRDLAVRCRHFVDSYDQDVDLGPDIAALRASLDALPEPVDA